MCKVKIDGDFILYTTTYAKKIAGIPEAFSAIDAISRTDELLHKILRHLGATSYVLALTYGKTFRHALNPEYKANRLGKAKPQFFNLIKQHLITTWGAIMVEGLEADDLVSIAYNEDGDKPDFTYVDTKRLKKVIVSPDKDILNLEGIHFNPRQDKDSWDYVITYEDEADHEFWKSMVVGDTADNIKGLMGKGEVYWLKLLELNKDVNLNTLVYKEYIKLYGPHRGILEFYKNYRCLYILKNTLDLGNIVLPEGILNPISYDCKKGKEVDEPIDY